MNENNYFQVAFNNAVNQALLNKERMWRTLPEDQQEALDKILTAIHDINENKRKILPAYQAQAWDAIILKLAAEMGLNNGGTNSDNTGNRF